MSEIFSAKLKKLWAALPEERKHCSEYEGLEADYRTLEALRLSLTASTTVIPVKSPANMESSDPNLVQLKGLQVKTLSDPAINELLQNFLTTLPSKKN